MADLTEALPYGIRDIKLTPYTDALGTVLADTSVDLPIARKLTFTESESFSDLRGDDRIAASHGSGAEVAWELESGGLPFEAFKVMAGGTIVTTGATPDTVKVYSKKITDQRPYFRIEGQVISDAGGDVHAVLYRCKATGDLGGEFSDGNFYLQGAKGNALAVPSGDDADKLYDFVQNESVTPFTEPNPGP